MSTPETTTGGGWQSGTDLSATESNLGQALALIHCALPHADEPQYAVRVQAALRTVASFIESACKAHAHDMGLPMDAAAQAAVDSETAAVIAAAVAMVLGRASKVVDLEPAPVPTPDLNAWAVEGRTQIFKSHRIR